MGTHTGAAFTPIPGKLPPVEKTGKQVKIGPEKIMKLQDNKEGDILRFASSKLPEFKAIDGLINVTSFMAEDNQAVVLAGYTSKDKLDAATPKIGAIMKEMGQFMAGPPTSFLTEVRWSTFD